MFAQQQHPGVVYQPVPMQPMMQPPGQPMMLMQPQPMQQMGAPMMMMQQGGMGGGPPGIVTVQYLQGEACNCCGGQPAGQGPLDVTIDGVEVATLMQGQMGQYPVAAGMHQIGCKRGGVGGFFTGLVGCDQVGSVVRQVGPGQNCQPVELGWQPAMGFGSGRDYTPYVR